MTHEKTGDSVVTSPVDGFDPRDDPNCTPFGIPCGSIPMGNIYEVLGKERAREVLRQLGEVPRG